MKRGDKVMVPQPTIEGEVVGRKIGEDDVLRHLVRWTDGAGEVQERAFLEEELKVVPEEKPEGGSDDPK